MPAVLQPRLHIEPFGYYAVCFGGSHGRDLSTCHRELFSSVRWLEFSPRKISVSKSPGCGRFIGSAGDRTSPSGNGAQSARITARVERLGNTFRTTMRARAPIAGAKTALPASATAIN